MQIAGKEIIYKKYLSMRKERDISKGLQSLGHFLEIQKSFYLMKQLVPWIMNQKKLCKKHWKDWPAGKQLSLLLIGFRVFRILIEFMF